GTHALSGSFDTSAIRWSLTRNAAEQVLRFHDGAVNAVAYLKDGRIVTAGADTHIAIWTPPRQQPDRILDGHAGPIASLAVAPDGEILTAGADGKVYFLSPTGEVLAEVQASETPIITIAVSPDGNLAAAAGIRGSVAVIERKTRKLTHTLVGPGLPVWSAAF